MILHEISPIKNCIHIPQTWSKNYLLKEDKKINELIDGLSLFIGNIDVNMLFDDFIEMFNSMEEREFNLGILKGNLGSGAIQIIS